MPDFTSYKFTKVLYFLTCFQYVKESKLNPAGFRLQRYSVFIFPPNFLAFFQKKVLCFYFSSKRGRKFCVFLRFYIYSQVFHICLHFEYLAEQGANLPQRCFNIFYILPQIFVLSFSIILVLNFLHPQSIFAVNIFYSHPAKRSSEAAGEESDKKKWADFLMVNKKKNI